MRSLVLTAALLILGPSSSAAAAPEPPATPLPAGSAGAIDQMLDGLGGVEAPAPNSGHPRTRPRRPPCPTRTTRRSATPR